MRTLSFSNVIGDKNLIVQFCIDLKDPGSTIEQSRIGHMKTVVSGHEK